MTQKRKVFGSLGYEQLTDLSSAVGLDSPPANCVHVLLQAESKDIRWTDDGVAPTATTGMILYAGAAPFPYEGPIDALQFIEVSASAKLNVAYYTKTLDAG